MIRARKSAGSVPSHLRPRPGDSVPLLLAAICCWWSVGPGGSKSAVAAEAVAGAEHTARIHFRQGETEYSAGKYREALAAYQAGYDEMPLPGFLVNIAQCQRRLGDLARARVTYHRFVMVAPDSPLVPEVRKLIDELDRLMAEAEVTQPTSAAPAAGGGLAPAGPAPPSKPPVSLSATTAPDRASAGADLNARGEPLRASPPGRRWWLWGAVAAVVVASAFVVVALSTPEATTIHGGSLGTLRR